MHPDRGYASAALADASLPAEDKMATDLRSAAVDAKNAVVPGREDDLPKWFCCFAALRGIDETRNVWIHLVRRGRSGGGAGDR